MGINTALWHSDYRVKYTRYILHSVYSETLEMKDISIPEHYFSPTFLQFSSVAQSCLTLCDPMDCSTPGLAVHHQLPEFTQTHVHWVGNAIQPAHPLLFPSSPAFNLSQHQGLSKWVSSFHQVAKYWSSSFSINPPNKYLGLISSRIDWFNLLAVQGTFKSLLQHHSSSIHSLALSLLYGPVLTSIHDYWKNHSFDYIDICQQSNVSAFEYAV